MTAMRQLQPIPKREQIITAAAKLVHLRGYNHTSLDEILAAADAGKGQFYHYFSSKEELGLAIVDRAAARIRATLLERVEQGQGLAAIRWMLRCLTDTAKRTKCGGGCPLGNLAAEMSDVRETFRRKLAGVFELWRRVVERALITAQRRGELRPGVNARQLSFLILSTIEGAILLAKVQHDARVMDRCFQGLWLCVEQLQQSGGGREENG
jgi:TetR/AcrR family transcriptional repressor of nem operon